MKTFQATYKILHRIYDKHRRQYRENSCDTGQMCLMWLTAGPPDGIESDVANIQFLRIEATEKHHE